MVAEVALEGSSVLPTRARERFDLIDEWAEFGDEEGRLAEPVVDALHEDGLFGMWVPAVLGGAELDPLQSLEVIANLSYGDPSAGWVLMAAALAIGTGGAYLGDEAAAELFADGRRPVIAGQGTRPGTATPTEGGFLLTGEWSFASGIKHASHIHTLGIIDTTGEPRIFVLPVEQATFVENWDVLGLRGTGSIDYTIDGAFVPEAYTHFATADVARRGGQLYGIGIIGFAEICHSGWAIGVGRRILDELTALARSKAGRPGAQAANEAFHQGLAEAEATYRAGRAFVFETWADCWDSLQSGERLTVDQHTLIRLSLTNMTSALHEIGEFAYLAAGTTALRRGTLQRLVRDMHAGTQHVTSSPPVVQACGRQLAGLEDGKVWRFLDLVDP